MAASQIEFYTQHGISPVRQDIGDLTRHFARRDALYRHLGILPAFVKARKVLEIGPGSGFNSLHTASLEPASYVLVEGNPTGVEDIHRLFSEFPDLKQRVRVVPSQLSDYDTSDLFDFVLCENVLSGVPDPGDTLQKVAGFVAPGGLLVITCNDSVSEFAETLRRLYAQLIVYPSEPIAVKVACLLPIFSQHLSRLPGMSRRHDNWIIDNLITPASLNKVLSIPEAIILIKEDFDIYGMSPHFVTDWRWYKDIASGELNFNRNAIDQYWHNVHNFFDYSSVLPPRSKESNRLLVDLCSFTRVTIRQLEETRDLRLLQDIQHSLGQIAMLVESFSVKLAGALKEAQVLLDGCPIDTEALGASTKFGSLFGRSAQYLSFNRRSR